MTVDILCLAAGLSSVVCLLPHRYQHDPLLQLPPASSAFTVSMSGRTPPHRLLCPPSSRRPFYPPTLSPAPFLRLSCHPYKGRHVDGRGPT